MIRVVCLLPKILSISVAHNHFLASAKTRQVYNLFQEPDDQELGFLRIQKEEHVKQSVLWRAGSNRIGIRL